MQRAPELYDFDEQGVIRRAIIDGHSGVIGKIHTSRQSFDQFGPFDQSERDLVRLAVAVLNADRQSSRRLSGKISEEMQEASRLRSLQLCIPMEDPARWHHAAPLLVRLLRFMTDDQWAFEFFLQTKGEVCRQAGTALGSLARVAMSCDETEARKRDLLHCGVCTSCLLRRVALRTALGDGDPTSYRDRGTRTHGDYDVQAFVSQAAKFKEACSSFNSLIKLDPDIRHALRYHADRTLSRKDAEQQMCSLFARQAAEAEGFMASAQFPRLPLVTSTREAPR